MSEKAQSIVLKNRNLRLFDSISDIPISLLYVRHRYRYFYVREIARLNAFY